MKKVILAAALVSFSFSALASGHSPRATTGTGSKTSHEHVSGYTTKSGTYVAPHERSTPDSTKTNNWSTKGNVNPITGKKGTK